MLSIRQVQPVSRVNLLRLHHSLLTHSARDILVRTRTCGAQEPVLHTENSRTRGRTHFQPTSPDLQTNAGQTRPDLEPCRNSCALETNQNGHESREAQWMSENTCVPTLKQHVNHQEHPEATPCSIGWSCSVLQLPRSWQFQSKRPKEARTSVWKRRWRASCILTNDRGVHLGAGVS